MTRAFSCTLLAAAALQPSGAIAHLLHEQYATMKIVDHSANFVVSVPASALEGVDLDGDGMLSVAEIDAGRDAIISQFNLGFSVSDRGATGEQVMTWVVSPETHDPGTPTDRVVVMHRVFFATPPVSPSIAFRLFGSQTDEQLLQFHATRGDKSEIVNLTPDANTHDFFTAGSGIVAADQDPVSDYSGLSYWVLLGFALVAISTVLGLFWARPRPLR